MDGLHIEPTCRVLLGEANRFRIMLVGAGGTGSTLALFLAGLLITPGKKVSRLSWHWLTTIWLK